MNLLSEPAGYYVEQKARVKFVSNVFGFTIFEVMDALCRSKF